MWKRVVGFVVLMSIFPLLLWGVYASMPPVVRYSFDVPSVNGSQVVSLNLLSFNGFDLPRGKVVLPYVINSTARVGDDVVLDVEYFVESNQSVNGLNVKNALVSDGIVQYHLQVVELDDNVVVWQFDIWFVLICVIGDWLIICVFMISVRLSD